MKKIITLIAIGASSLCLAQHTVYDLIDFGLKNSLEIKRTLISKENSRTNLNNSYLSILPDANINYNRFQARTMDDDLGIYNSESASLNLGKSISLNEPTYYNIRRSKIADKNADITLDEQNKMIATAIFNKFISVIQTEQNRQIAQKNLEIQIRVYEMSQIKYDSGNLSEFELQNAEMNYLSQQIQLQDYQNMLVEYRQDLFSYIGMDDDGEELSDPEIEIMPVKLSGNDNNLLKIARNNLSSNKLSLTQERLNLFPIPIFSFNLSYSNNTDVFDSALYEDNMNFGVGVSYNIFDIPSIINSYKNTKRNLQISSLEYELDATDNQDDIEMAQIKINSLNKSLKLYEQKLLLAENNYEKAEKQYELGLINLTDLETSRVELQNAQTNKNNKYFNLIKQQEQLNMQQSNKILGRY